MYDRTSTSTGTSASVSTAASAGTMWNESARTRIGTRNCRSIRHHTRWPIAHRGTCRSTRETSHPSWRTVNSIRSIGMPLTPPPGSSFAPINLQAAVLLQGEAALPPKCHHHQSSPSQQQCRQPNEATLKLRYQCGKGAPIPPKQKPKRFGDTTMVLPSRQAKQLRFLRKATSMPRSWNPAEATPNLKVSCKYNDLQSKLLPPNIQTTMPSTRSILSKCFHKLVMFQPWNSWWFRVFSIQNRVSNGWRP